MPVFDLDPEAELEPSRWLQEIADWTRASERWVDSECLNLYAGTNIQSPAVRRALATTLNSRPSLGDPGDKYETGLEYADRIENLCSALLRRLFRARFVELRALSGSMANLLVYMAVTRPGDPILAMPVAAAGHASHSSLGVAGRYGLDVHDIPCRPGTHLVDWDCLERVIRRVRPRLVVTGSSLPLLPTDLRRVRELAASIGAPVLYDSAHVAGLIAGGRFQDPLADGADIVTCSTYKSFGGPAGGLILTGDEDLARRLRDAAYPGLVANFDLARVAGTAVAALELVTFGGDYAAACLANAQMLADELRARGLPVFSPDGGGTWTRSHLVAVDAREFGGGTAAARACEPAGLLFSGIPLPLEAPGAAYAGLRLGVQELTRWGLGPEAMGEVAELLAEALRHPERAPALRERTRRLRSGFQTLRFALD